MSKYLDRIVWNSDGLLPVIVQDIFTNKVIMFAWMNNRLSNPLKKEKQFIGRVQEKKFGLRVKSLEIFNIYKKYY